MVLANAALARTHIPYPNASPLVARSPIGSADGDAGSGAGFPRAAAPSDAVERYVGCLVVELASGLVLGLVSRSAWLPGEQFRYLS